MDFSQLQMIFVMKICLSLPENSQSTLVEWLKTFGYSVEGHGFDFPQCSSKSVPFLRQVRII